MLQVSSSACSLSHERASSNKRNRSSVCDLLCERPTNWRVIEQRARTNEDSFPDDFLAKILLLAHPLPSFALFEWFLLQFGESAGYYGFGCKQEDVSHLRTAMRVICIRIKGYPQSHGNFFFACKSLKSARHYWSIFGDSPSTRKDAIDFVLGRIRGGGHDGSPWSTSKMANKEDVWECYVFLVHKLSAACPWVNQQNNNVGHAVVYIITTLAFHTDLRDVLSCLCFLHTHNPNVFLEQSDEGNTMLDLVMSKSNEIATSIKLPDNAQRCAAVSMMELMLHLTPTTRMVDFHKLLLEGNYGLAQLVQKACPSAVNSRCLGTGLYPFQLASMDKRRPGCECCLTSSDASLSSLTTTYTFLRQSPHLLLLASSIKDDQERSGCMSSERIALAKEQLRLLRKRVDIERSIRILAMEEKAWSIKQKRLNKP